MFIFVYCDILDGYSSNYTKRIKEELDENILNFEIKPEILGDVSILASTTGFFTGTTSIHGSIAVVATAAALGIEKANNAQSKADDAQDDADTAQTTADTADGKADTALSIWNVGSVFAGDADNEAYDYTNNIYHLQTGNVGIGVTNDIYIYICMCIYV